jgi:light-regulated signal transduction histidine kinase (bacteriophytochrome)
LEVPKRTGRIHPEDRERIARERAACIERRRSDWTYEYRAVLPDGMVRYLEGRSRLFYLASGSLERIRGTTIDVTERHNLRQSLIEHSTQLERSNEELQRFAYVVSHDLKEPVRSIGVMAELFLMRNLTTLDTESQELLEYVTRSSQRMKQLIEDLLELSRTGSRAPPTAAELTEADVSDAENFAVDGLHGIIAECGASITCDPMPVVRANESQLVRVFRLTGQS